MLKTVEIPQVPFLDKLFMSVVVMSGADGQTVLKNVEIPQVPFLDKVYPPVVFVWCQWPDNAENCGYAAVAVIRRERAENCGGSTVQFIDVACPVHGQGC